jgi:hypothetical protein
VLSYGSDSDSSGNGIPGSQVQGYSHPYPKRVRLSLSGGVEQPVTDGKSSQPEDGKQPSSEMPGFRVGDFFIPCTSVTSGDEVTLPSSPGVAHPSTLVVDKKEAGSPDHAAHF